MTPGTAEGRRNMDHFRLLFDTCNAAEQRVQPTAESGQFRALVSGERLPTCQGFPFSGG
jgi:hypothetical protein